MRNLLKYLSLGGFCYLAYNAYSSAGWMALFGTLFFAVPMYLMLVWYINVEFDKSEKATEAKKSPIIGHITITAVGPVFGRQFDSDLHEWIDAINANKVKQRFMFGGPARYNEDGSLNLYSKDASSGFVINGIQYELVTEPKN